MMAPQMTVAEIFSKEVDDLTLDKEIVKAKISDLTVGEFVKIMRIVINKKNPFIRRIPHLGDKISAEIRKHPDGIHLYQLAKLMPTDYKHVRYHVRNFERDNKIIIEREIKNGRIVSVLIKPKFSEDTKNDRQEGTSVNEIGKSNEAIPGSQQF